MTVIIVRNTNDPRVICDPFCMDNPYNGPTEVKYLKRLVGSALATTGSGIRCTVGWAADEGEYLDVPTRITANWPKDVNNNLTRGDGITAVAGRGVVPPRYSRLNSAHNPGGRPCSKLIQIPP